ncbi:hypothetical protein AWW67_14125 [Roseivirga seohaensis]|uniref:Uncharacterized protein n=1 Tax=Roseivirga seohaensis TaxID=1914963 RepID=A0A150Y3R8_9BACT|nr:hypothetical protein [Roseivirga seohaensis]KYG85515.1 hypothetical protein AWW67_14125 [Roseivirga seohaensis]
MIRVYLDWNLYSILKQPKLEPHLILNSFLQANSDKIQLVYSSSHLDDLSETSSGKRIELQKDLLHLSRMTNNICIVSYWGSEKVILDNRDPTEFFHSNLKNNSGFVLGFFEWLRKLVTNRYGQIRDGVIQPHLNIDVTKICNYKVLDLDKMIREAKLSDSLENFLKKGLELRGSRYDKLSYIDYYYTAYTALDLISFYPDSMKEKGNFENLKNDANHSAYGSLCHAFITNDNKCYNKSKFLFDYFGSKSTLIRTCKRKNIGKLKEELNNLLITGSKPNRLT